MVEKMQAAGIPITMEEITETAGGDIVSRAHFARVLVRKKVVSSIDAAFKRLIGKGMPYYEPRACLALTEATALIRRAGGVAVIAHPFPWACTGPPSACSSAPAATRASPASRRGIRITR